MDKYRLSEEVLEFIEQNTEHILHDDIEKLNEVWTRIYNSVPDEKKKFNLKSLFRTFRQYMILK